MDLAKGQDPRRLNEVFDLSSIEAYRDGYVALLHSTLTSLDSNALRQAAEAIETAATAGRRIFSIGNGGSAAIADHLCCDWTKGTHVEDRPVIDTTSLTANMALYSALANDHGFETVFARQLDWVGKQGDVLIAISSSGNSANIVSAVEIARRKGMVTVGLSGFGGGVLRESVDIAIHADAANYGVVEDAHQAAMHIIAQYVAGLRDARGGKGGPG